MLFLTESDVRLLLPMPRAIELVERGFLHLAEGRASNHPRRRLQLGASAMLHYMAAVDTATGYLGAKIYATHPAGGAHFVVVLFDAEGRLLAAIEANALGQIRTGAATGVATRHLARPDASIVGLIGSGFQARTQLEAVSQVRRLSEARVYSRSPEKRQAFAAEMSRSLALPVRAVASAEEAVRGCHIAIIATSARDPVLLGEWLPAGVHVDAVGSNHARRAELDRAAVARASLIAVDSMEQARMECGDLIAAYRDDPSGWGGVVELADVVAGRCPGRSSDEQVTLFESQGTAIEDIAVAGYIYQQAVGGKS